LNHLFRTDQTPIHDSILRSQLNIEILSKFKVDGKKPSGPACGAKVACVGSSLGKLPGWSLSNGFHSSLGDKSEEE
jgi:hypothetical protein